MVLSDPWSSTNKQFSSAHESIAANQLPPFSCKACLICSVDMDLKPKSYSIALSSRSFQFWTQMALWEATGEMIHKAWIWIEFILNQTPLDTQPFMLASRPSCMNITSKSCTSTLISTLIQPNVAVSCLETPLPTRKLRSNKSYFRNFFSSTAWTLT